MHINDGHGSCAQEGPSVTISTAGLLGSFKRFSHSSKIKQVLSKLGTPRYQNPNIRITVATRRRDSTRTVHIYGFRNDSSLCVALS